MGATKKAEEERLRAIAIDNYGEPEVARLVDLPSPQPGPGEVAIDVKAVALNHVDLWSSSGALGFDIAFPFILGADGAGEVARIGPGVTAVEAGARVLIDPGLSCGTCDACRRGDTPLCPDFRMLGEHVNGTFAETIVVPEGNAVPIPAHLSYVQAAALGVTFITAYRMLFTVGELQRGESVLITGIGGGLALSLLQLALPVAGRIIVTSSARDKLDRALALGAHDAIDYRAEDVGAAVRRLTGKRGVDLVADSAGGPTVDASLRSLAPGGRLVISGATAGRHAEVDVRRLFWRGLRILGSTMGSHSDVERVLRLVSDERIEPIVDSMLGFADVVPALERLRDGHQFGKIVLEV